MMLVPSAEPAAEFSSSCLEEFTASEEPRSQSGLRRVWGAGALLLLATAAAAVAFVAKTSSSPSIQEGAESSVQDSLVGFTQIVAQNAKTLCSKPWAGPGSEDCSATKCCTVTGYFCFEKQAGEYGCLEQCDPSKGWTCNMPHDIVPLVEVSSQPQATLFCWSVYTRNTGSTKKSYELELLQKQYEKKVSLFSCDYSVVYSDVVVDIGSDMQTLQVNDDHDEFHLIKRKVQKTWINTGLFKQVWRAMRDYPDEALQNSDWVVKVDADAVFVPQRLRNMLTQQPDTYTGVYIENCKGVEWGYFGNLEIMSKTAFKLLLDNIDSCSDKIDWVKGTKWGPIGEDLFAQMCMDWQGVAKIDNFEVTTDGACPGTRKRYGEADNKKWKPPCGEIRTPAMHPFKKPADYFQCLDATMALGV